MSYYYYCYKCNINLGTSKLLRFHEKYVCGKDKPLYTPHKCKSCTNVFTTQKRLDKHNKKCGVVIIHDINKLKKNMIENLWNIVFEYITKIDINVYNACYENSEDILNCIYIKNGFSFNKIRSKLPSCFNYMFYNHRTKLVKKILLNMPNYIPTIIEYNVINNSKLPNAFMQKTVLKNIINNKDIYYYIIEENIVNLMTFFENYRRRIDEKYVDALIKQCDYKNNEKLQNIIKKYVNYDNNRNIDKFINRGNNDYLKSLLKEEEKEEEKEDETIVEI